MGTVLGLLLIHETREFVSWHWNRDELNFIVIGVMLIGVFHGLLIVKGRLNGFIVTLGMTIVLAGLQQGIVKGNTLFNLPAPFNYLGAKEYGQVPVSLIVAARRG